MEKSIHTYVVPAYGESSYLEECIRSVLHQAYPSRVIIATSTPNDHIYGIADKYRIQVKVNPETGRGIGCDFEFARTCADTPLVTIAHQDDRYDYEYSKNVVQYFMEYRDALIIFSDYYEIRGSKRVSSNLNMRIKRLLLLPMRMKKTNNSRIMKRSILSLGNSICCPAVCFANNNIRAVRVFDAGLLCNVDWMAWEKLSREKGRFVYINKLLMGHRVHEASTTSEIINGRIRTKEDYEVLRLFWPKQIAKAIARVYSLSERSNQS